MAVHSFASIGEIQDAKTDQEKEVLRAKVLAESRIFDTCLREAVQKNIGEERKKALLKLESLPEFKRSHPTVEVNSPNHVLNYHCRQNLSILTTDDPWLAFHPPAGSSWRRWGCEGGAPWH